MSSINLLAIDPGTTESAFVVYNTGYGEVMEFGKLPNGQLIERIRTKSTSFRTSVHEAVIEQVACYGMRVGREVFETCEWSGEFRRQWYLVRLKYPYRLTRKEVVLRLCHTPRAGDAEVRAKLIDLFGPGKERAIGRKAKPGPLYGVKGDVWAALAVAVAWRAPLTASPLRLPPAAGECTPC